MWRILDGLLRHRLLVALVCLASSWAPEASAALPEQNGVQLLEAQDGLTRQSILRHLRARQKQGKSLMARELEAP